MSGTLTPGARAALELRLSDARRDLAEAIEAKNAATHQGDVYRALADESSGSRRAARNAEAVKFRLRAAGISAEVAEHRKTVEALEAMLAGACAAPVVLSAEQVAAADEMAFCGVAS